MIDPLLVGGGKRIFPDDGALRPLRLVDHEVTSAGAIIAVYAPAWELFGLPAIAQTATSAAARIRRDHECRLQ